MTSKPSKPLQTSKRSPRPVLAGLICFILLPWAAVAHAADLKGRVTDSLGQPIVGASVRVACPSQSPRTMAASSDGEVEFPGLPAARCDVDVTADGYEPYDTARDLTDGSQVLDVVLEKITVRGEIVVTAGLPELATERRFSGTDIVEAGTEDLAEFFRGVAGAGAVRRGPVNLEPQIRGLQEEQVGTFVDGTRTFAAGPARMDSNISHVSSHSAQNLRVIKGPYALAWGSGTLSALEIDTFRPEFAASDFRWQGTASLGWNDNAGSLDAFGGIWGSSDKLRFYLNGGRREGDDYEAGDDSVVPGDYESTETRWRLGYRPSDQLLVEYSGGYQEQFDLDYPGRLLDATYFYARSHVLEFTWNGDGSGEIAEVYGQVYANYKDHRMNNDEKPTGMDAPGRIPPFALDIDLPTESNTAGGRFRVDGMRDALNWSLGLDHYRVEQTASRTIARRSNGFVIFKDIVWPDAEIEDLGGYGQVVYGGDGYRVGATVRLDEVDASAGQLSPFFLANTTGSTDQSESHVSAAVSATFDLGDHWTLATGVGRAVRTATVLERYSDRFPATKFQLAAEFMGNPELDPEESLELNLGLSTATRDLSFSVDVFYREIDDYITVIADPTLPKRLPLSPPVVYRYINGEGAEFYGGELLLTHRLNERFSWRGSLAYVRAEDEELDEPVLGIPPLTAEVGVRYRDAGERFWIDLGARIADRQDRVASARFEQETPGYTILNLAAQVRLNERLALRGGVDNLTDKAYADHLNSPNPFTRQRILEIGRSFRLGFEVDF